MSDALYDLLDIDETDSIDPTELARIKRVLNSIKVEAAGIAREHDTDDTVVLLDALLLSVKAFRKGKKPTDARKIISTHASGEEVSFGNVDPETARKAAEYDELLKASKGSAPKGLGSGSGTDAILEQLRPFVEADPKVGDNLVKILTSLAGGPEDTRQARSILALSIVEGSNPDWVLVKDPASGQMLPAILVDALVRGKQLETTNRQLNDHLDPKVKGSIGWKAAGYDYNVDSTKPNSLQAQLDTAAAARDAALADKQTVQQELTNERDANKKDSLAQQLAQAKANAALPADMVKKDGVKAKVREAREALDRIMGVRKDTAEQKLRELADMVK